MEISGYKPVPGYKDRCQKPVLGYKTIYPDLYWDINGDTNKDRHVYCLLTSCAAVSTIRHALPDNQSLDTVLLAFLP